MEHNQLGINITIVCVGNIRLTLYLECILYIIIGSFVFYWNKFASIISHFFPGYAFVFHREKVL